MREVIWVFDKPMRKPSRIRLLLCLLTLALGVTESDVLAQTGRPITVREAWARLDRDNRRMATVYFLIENAASESDALVGVWTPIADKATMSVPHWRGMLMSMRGVDEIAVPANGWVMLRPGAYQVDILQLAYAMRPGQSIPLELRFARAGRVEITAVISNKLLPDQLRVTPGKPEDKEKP